MSAGVEIDQSQLTPETVSFAGVVAPAGSRWFVVHTKSRQEKALAADLTAHEVPHYLPLITRVQYYGRRKVRAQFPLFPGYLFLLGTPEQTYTADRTDRVAHIIKVGDQQRLTEDLANIRAAIDRGATLELCPRIEVGTRVEVSSGPFKGIQGTVEEGTAHDRFVLHVGLVGAAALLEIDRSLLRPVD